MARRDLPDWLVDELDQAQRSDLARSRVTVERPEPGKILVDGRLYVDFSSNDYLGLAVCPKRAARAIQILQERAPSAWGSAASPLITGYHSLTAQFEQRWATFVGAQNSLLFPSGHAANEGTLASLLGSEDVVFCDKRNHASLIDGIRRSGAKLRVYRTDALSDRDRSLKRLANELGKASSARCRWIVTDSVFSMDGDIAPLTRLAELADQFDAYLYVDEAHATGLLGPTGAGAVEELGLLDRVDLRMATLSKAIGSIGGIVSGSNRWIDALVQRARPYIYSTALPPTCIAASWASLDLLFENPQSRERLIRISDEFRQMGSDLGLIVTGEKTPIVSLIVGSALQAIQIAQFFRSKGIWAAAIRPPTVPSNFSRVRFCFSSYHTDNELCHLFDTLRQLDPGQSHVIG